MNGIEQLRVEKTSEIIAFYQKDFNKYYAVLIGLTEVIPTQINNEIRNAFSHLARINIVKTEVEIFDETAKAIGHIERACRDCLKICIAQTYDNIKLQFDYALTYYKAISPMHVAEKKAIIEERKNITHAEVNGEKNLTKRFEALLQKCIDLQDGLEEQYGLPPKQSSKIKLLLTQWFGAGAIAGISKIIFLIIGAGLMWVVKYFGII